MEPSTFVAAHDLDQTSPKKLTKREHDVLMLMAEGHSTKHIATVLGITFKTAACHRSRILEKLGAHNTVTVVRCAIRSGLIQA